MREQKKGMLHQSPNRKKTEGEDGAKAWNMDSRAYGWMDRESK